MSLLGGITGADESAKKSKKAAKKAKKANDAIVRNEQMPANQKIYEDQKATAAAAEAKSDAALKAAGANQQNALKGALQGQTAAINQNRADQMGIYQPYQQYGQEGMGLSEGMFGESPEASAAFMQRFENSPLYQATYQSAMDEARQAAERAGAAGSGINNGRLLQELMRKGGQIGRNTIMDYSGLINTRIGMGMNAANALGGALMGNTGLASSAYGNYGQQSSSAYGNLGANQASNFNQGASNTLAAGNLYSNNMNQGYNALAGNNTALANAKMAANQGAANTNASVLNGGMNALGSVATGPKPWFIS